MHFKTNRQLITRHVLRRGVADSRCRPIMQCTNRGRSRSQLQQSEKTVSQQLFVVFPVCVFEVFPVCVFLFLPLFTTVSTSVSAECVTEIRKMSIIWGFPGSEWAFGWFLCRIIAKNSEKTLRRAGKKLLFKVKDVTFKCTFSLFNSR